MFLQLLPLLLHLLTVGLLGGELRGGVGRGLGLGREEGGRGWKASRDVWLSQSYFLSLSGQLGQLFLKNGFKKIIVRIRIKQTYIKV